MEIKEIYDDHKINPDHVFRCMKHIGCEGKKLTDYCSLDAKDPKHEHLYMVDGTILKFKAYPSCTEKIDMMIFDRTRCTAYDRDRSAIDGIEGNFSHAMDYLNSLYRYKARKVAQRRERDRDPVPV